MARWTENMLLASSPHYTSELLVYAGAPINVCLWIGSVDESYTSVVQSRFSCTLQLQRKLPGSPLDDMWRVVAEYVLTGATGKGGDMDVVITSGPEACVYRFGVPPGGLSAGAAYARLVTK